MRELPDSWASLPNSVIPIVVIEIYGNEYDSWDVIRLASHKVRIFDEGDCPIYENRIKRLGKVVFNVDLSKGGNIAEIPSFDFDIENADLWFEDLGYEIKNREIRVFVTFRELGRWDEGECNTFVIDRETLFEVFRGVIDRYQVSNKRVKVDCLGSWIMEMGNIPGIMVRDINEPPPGWITYSQDKNIPVVFGRNLRTKAIFFDFYIIKEIDGSGTLVRYYWAPKYAKVNAIYSGDNYAFASYIEGQKIYIITENESIDNVEAYFQDKVSSLKTPTEGSDEVKDKDLDTYKLISIPAGTDWSEVETFSYSGAKPNKFILILAGYISRSSTAIEAKFKFSDGSTSTELFQEENGVIPLAYKTLPPGYANFQEDSSGKRKVFKDTDNLFNFKVVARNTDSNTDHEMRIYELLFILYVPEKELEIDVDGPKFNDGDRIPPYHNGEQLIEEAAYIVEFIFTKLLGLAVDEISIDAAAAHNPIKMAFEINGEKAYQVLRKICREGGLVLFNNGVVNKLVSIELNEPVVELSESDYNNIISGINWDIYSEVVLEYTDLEGQIRQKKLTPDECDIYCWEDICDTYQQKCLNIERMFGRKRLNLKVDYVKDDCEVERLLLFMVDWMGRKREKIDVQIPFKKELFQLEIGDTVRIFRRGQSKDVIVTRIELNLSDLSFRIKGEW